MTDGAKPEFSRIVSLEELESREIWRKIEADEAERRALAARFDLLALNSLSAEVKVSPVSGGPLVRVSGTVSADVVQSSVISLRPVPGHVDETFSETFAPEGYRAEIEGDEEMPEVFGAEGVDVGEVVAQVLALSLDPYPRAAGETLVETGAPVTEGRELRRPFADLGEMMKKRK